MIDWLHRRTPEQKNAIRTILLPFDFRKKELGVHVRKYRPNIMELRREENIAQVFGPTLLNWSNLALINSADDGANVLSHGRLTLSRLHLP